MTPIKHYYSLLSKVTNAGQMAGRKKKRHVKGIVKQHDEIGKRKSTDQDKRLHERGPRGNTIFFFFPLRVSKPSFEE